MLGFSSLMVSIRSWTTPPKIDALVGTAFLSHDTELERRYDMCLDRFQRTNFDERLEEMLFLREMQTKRTLSYRIKAVIDHLVQFDRPLVCRFSYVLTLRRVTFMSYDVGMGL
jgi:hypothetical protein